MPMPPDSMTDTEKRVRELQDIIYAIDFTCRASSTATEAVRLIRDLCRAAKVPGVQAEESMVTA